MALLFKTTVTSFVDVVTTGTVVADFVATPNVSAEPDNAVCVRDFIDGITFLYLNTLIFNTQLSHQIFHILILAPILSILHIQYV